MKRFMRLRNFAITKAVLRGGVVSAESIPRELLKEMYEVGNRRGHFPAFITLLRNSASWETATKVYGLSTCPSFWFGATKIGQHPKNVSTIAA